MLCSCSKRYAGCLASNFINLGHLDIVKWAVENNFTRNILGAIESACESESIEVVKYLVNFCETSRKTRFVFSDICVQNAATKGRLDLLKYIFSSKKFKINVQEDMLKQGCESGNLEVVKFLEEQGYVWKVVPAEFNNNLDLLIYSREKGAKWDPNVIYHAVRSVQLDIVKWAVLNGCPFPPKIPLPVDFLRNGGLQILKWLREQKITFTEPIFSFTAASEGNLETLIWMNEVGEYKHPDTFKGAIISGKLDVVKWVISNGYEFVPEKGCVLAFDYGHSEILEWIVSEYKIDVLSIQWISMSATIQIPVLKFLHKNGVELSPDLYSACLRQKNLKAFEWLIEIGVKIEWNEESVGKHTLQFAIERGYPINEATLFLALELQAYDSITLILQKNPQILTKFVVTEFIVDQSPVCFLLWLKSIGFSFPESLAFSAIEKDRVYLIRKLHQLGIDLKQRNLCLKPNSRVCKWAEKFYYPTMQTS